MSDADRAFFNERANDIYGEDKAPPKAWKMSANPLGEINSNYGYLIYSETNGEQYKHALNELLANTNSRRASMVYQRPGIWHDHDADLKNDFICTNAVTYYIRDKKVHAVVQMRSNDVVFGYKNDYAWQRYVLEQLTDDLQSLGKTCEVGTIMWQVQNLHVYERHFNLIK